MCTMIESGGDVIDGGGELKKLVGEKNIVLIGTGTLDDNECLCHVDVEATAKRAGFKCHRPKDGWPDWVLERARE